MAATRTARTAWDGGLADGTGQVELTSSGLGTFAVSWPRRTDAANDGQGTTPEELIAAAHSACYSMACSNEIAKAGGTPIRLETQAEVTFEAPNITGIKLTVRAEVEGLDEAGFRTAAEAAKAGCPVSKALTGVPITLDAALETA